jgi:Zn-dependent metalloprotease
LRPRSTRTLAALTVSLAAAGLLPLVATTATATAAGTRSQPSVLGAPTARPDALFGASAREAALQHARQQAPALAPALGLSRAEKLQPRAVERDADGTEHVRYDRTADGLRVIGGDLVVHTEPTGRRLGTDFATDGSLDWVAGSKPEVSARAATETVAARQHLVDGTVGGTALVVWAVSGVPRLAWETKVRGTDADGGPVRRVEYVDAGTGERITGWSEIQHVDGSGTSLYSGTVPLRSTLVSGTYKLKDPTRGNGFVVDAKNQQDPPNGYLAGTLFSDPDNVWGSRTAANRQAAAVDAAYGGAETWDYFKETFGRSGIRGDGVGAKSRVHYDVGLDNAFWDDACFCMTYGDGGGYFNPVVSLDVAGHEMTHGITSNTAGLLYVGESGGLNEATSDIFGTMVEFAAANPADPGDYYIGEKFVKPAFGSPALRRMDQPGSDGSSFSCWNLTQGAEDVHYTSGIGNHFFYLLAEGTAAKTIGGLPHQGMSCTGSTFAGIGRTAAAALWWRALTVYMTSTTSYIDARDATIRAALDLYPTTPAQCAAVVRAWEAVSVPRGSWTCAGPLGDGASTITTNPGFESGTTGWTFGGTAAATRDPALGFPHSGTTWASFGNKGVTNTSTVTRTVTVPSTPTATLRFDLLVHTEEQSFFGEYDTFDVLVNGTKVGAAGHWSNLHGNDTYLRWAVPMGAYAGRTVTLRFQGVEDQGWLTKFLLDDVALTPR